MNENFCDAVRSATNLRARHGLQRPSPKAAGKEARIDCLQSATPLKILCRHLRDALAETKAVGQLMRSIHGYTGHLNHPRGAQALTAGVPAPWTWCRCPRAVAFFKDMQPRTGHGRYVFPNIRTGKRPMSENTINAALRDTGVGSVQI
jgi:hypothetical protein